MVEAFSRRGQFNGWTDEQVNNKINLLVPIIKRDVGLRISVSVDKLAFIAHLRSIATQLRNHNTDKAYCVAFQRMLLEVPKVQLLHAYYFGSQPRPIDFIFDEQGEIGLEAQSTWLNIKRLSERLAQQGRTDLRPCLGEMPIFREDKGFPPLQAADLYAWNVRRCFFQNRRLIMPAPWYLRELADIRPIHAYLGNLELQELRFGSLKAQAEFKKMNPNVDLLSYQGSKAEQKRNRIMRRALAKSFRRSDKN
jgi:hypothetical protein